jgi:hypothetical protein
MLSLAFNCILENMADPESGTAINDKVGSTLNNHFGSSNWLKIVHICKKNCL